MVTALDKQSILVCASGETGGGSAPHPIIHWDWIGLADDPEV
jgi:hypothetical protein